MAVLECMRSALKSKFGKFATPTKMGLRVSSFQEIHDSSPLVEEMELLGFGNSALAQ